MIIFTPIIIIILVAAGGSASVASTALGTKIRKDRQWGGYLLSYTVPIIALISIVLQIEIHYLNNQISKVATAAAAATTAAAAATTAAAAATAAIAAITPV